MTLFRGFLAHGTNHTDLHVPHITVMQLPYQRVNLPAAAGLRNIPVLGLVRLRFLHYRMSCHTVPLPEVLIYRVGNEFNKTRAVFDQSRGRNRRTPCPT